MNELVKSAKYNLDYFHAVKLENTLKLCDHFRSLIETVTKADGAVDKIRAFAPSYDFDELSPGNGYRSFVYVYDLAVQQTIELSKAVQAKRGSFFFQSKAYEKKIETYTRVLNNLLIMAQTLEMNHSKANSRCLFSDEGVYDNTIRKTIESVDMEAFYGRALLFFSPRSLRRSVLLMAAGTAMYSEYYFSAENFILKWLRMPQTFLKYYFCPDSLSKRLVEVVKNAQIDFTTSFLDFFEWKPYEMVQSIFQPWVAVNETFQIPAEPISVTSIKNGKMIEIPVPSSHIGPGPVSCRLLSAQRRKGMISFQKKKSSVDPSKCLIFHVHGGGWISQSTKFHLQYLREWAVKLDVPILSIDYSLAPRAPFPRCINEVFFAYVWALNNMESLGSTGDNILFVGDSAGANLVTACIIKCIEMGIRKPNGLLTIYGVFALNYITNPSRFIGIMDILLPYNQFQGMFRAYAGCHEALADDSENREVPKNARLDYPPIPQNCLLSPYHAPENILKEFPKTIMLSTNIDPCLDDSVEFAKNLKQAGVDLRLEVLQGINHGFLAFVQISSECHEGSVECMKHIADFLKPHNSTSSSSL